MAACPSISPSIARTVLLILFKLHAWCRSAVFVDGTYHDDTGKIALRPRILADISCADACNMIEHYWYIQLHFNSVFNKCCCYLFVR